MSKKHNRIRATFVLLIISLFIILPSLAQACMTVAQVSAERSTCLLIYDNVIYNTRGNYGTHHGHQCGTDISGAWGSQILNWHAARDYFLGRYLYDTICSACVPTTEICNNLDDNCDTLIDNGVAPQSQSCPITNGLGTQSRTCSAGSWSGWSTCTVVSCNTGYQQSGNSCVAVSCSPGSSTESCTITNGVGSRSRTCTNPPNWDAWGTCTVQSCNTGYQISGNSCVAVSCSPGSTTQSCDVGTGACLRTGIQYRTCNLGVWSDWDSCSATPGTPTSEICNNINDDCDGSVDEDLTQSNTCGVGACQRTITQTCSLGQWGPICTPGSLSAELCNSIDDNCDGQTDEGCSCTDGQTQACGSDIGECIKGTIVCANGQWPECLNDVSSTLEICNGLDDDCNGQIDDGITCGCATGESASCGLAIGICKEGSKTCNNGVWSECINSIGPQNETCNGLDDNCNGETDENITTTISCGSGECKRTITQTCASGQFSPECFPGFPSSEICNGLDDDCNDQVDDDCIANNTISQDDNLENNSITQEQETGLSFEENSTSLSSNKTEDNQEPDVPTNYGSITDKTNYIIGRITGMLAYLCIALSAIIGVYRNYLIHILGRKKTIGIHAAVSVLGIVFILIHVVSLINDNFRWGPSLRVLQAIIPLFEDSRFVAYGTIALYFIIIGTVGGFFFKQLKKRFGYKLWVWIHRTTYISYILVYIHSLFLGTDFSSYQFLFIALFLIIIGKYIADILSRLARVKSLAAFATEKKVLKKEIVPGLAEILNKPDIKDKFIRFKCFLQKDNRTQDIHWYTAYDGSVSVEAYLTIHLDEGNYTLGGVILYSGTQPYIKVTEVLLP